MTPLAACIADALQTAVCRRRFRRETITRVPPLLYFRTQVTIYIHLSVVRLFASKESVSNAETIVADTERAERLLAAGKLEEAKKLLGSVYERAKESSLVSGTLVEQVRRTETLADGYIAMSANEPNAAIDRLREAAAESYDPGLQNIRVAALIGIAESDIRKRHWDAALEKLREAEALKPEADQRSYVRMLTGDIFKHRRGWNDPSVASQYQDAIADAVSPSQAAESHLHYASAVANRPEHDEALDQLEIAWDVCGGEAWDKGCSKETKRVIETLRRGWQQ